MTPEIKNRIAQIRRGEVPAGYKKIKTIIIPSNWEIFPLRSFVSISSGSTPERKTAEYWNGDIPWINTSELSNTNIIKASEYITQAGVEAARLHMTLPGTILMAMYGQGKTRGTVARLGIEATINQACVALEVHERHVVDYVFLQLQHSYHDIRKLSNSGSQENLNSKIIASIKVPLAVREEQIKIAAIFATQDKVIELKEKRIAEKQRQKKYLVQQLLTGKKRLAGFSDDWRVEKLKDISTRISQRNDVRNTNILTISAQRGLINQSDFFNKSIASEDKSNYFLLHKGDFAYNKSYSSGYSFGAIKRLLHYADGIVSPLYICFRIVCPNVSTDFLEQYFEAGIMDQEIQAFAQEGARNHGLLNISISDFFNSSITLPSYPEQIKIATILCAAGKEIDLLQKDLEAEKQKKRALMQLLLTGIVRVKV